eukprot:COSAG05_NODE_461_length_9571_cov_14.935283_7_plen_75_part_00
MEAAQGVDAELGSVDVTCIHPFGTGMLLAAGVEVVVRDPTGAIQRPTHRAARAGGTIRYAANSALCPPPVFYAA